jgi:myo-inositol-1(or 4)-monophosphatase
MWEIEALVARRAAMEAGKILNRLFGRTDKISKKGAIDLVTEADLQSEKKILEVLTREFPGDRLLTEESGLHEQRSQRTWIIDPLDGTTNFAHGFPFFAISMALEVDGELVLGVVYNPHAGEYFEALLGQGAHLNSLPIEVSSVQRLNEALLATGFPYDIHEDPDHVMTLFRKMVTKAQGVRRPGSAALDLCYVASGIFDGFWEERLQPWDTAAGCLILTEAGGRVSTFKGDPYNPYLPSILAANPPIHAALLKAIRD